MERKKGNRNSLSDQKDLVGGVSPFYIHQPIKKLYSSVGLQSLISRPYFIPIPVDPGTHFAPGHAMSVMFVPGWQSWNFFPYTCQSVLIGFFLESRDIYNGIFSIFILFSIPLLFFFDFDNIFMLVIIKMKANVLWEMPVTASLLRAPHTFRTMDRRSCTNKSLRKGLIIYIETPMLLSSRLSRICRCCTKEDTRAICFRISIPSKFDLSICISLTLAATRYFHTSSQCVHILAHTHAANHFHLVYKYC